MFIDSLSLCIIFQNSQEKVRLWLTLWLVFIIVLLILQIFSIYHGGRVNVRAGGSLGALLLFIYGNILTDNTIKCGNFKLIKVEFTRNLGGVRLSH